MAVREVCEFARIRPESARNRAGFRADFRSNAAPESGPISTGIRLEIGPKSLRIGRIRPKFVELGRRPTDRKLGGRLRSVFVRAARRLPIGRDGPPRLGHFGRFSPGIVAPHKWDAAILGRPAALDLPTGAQDRERGSESRG